MNLSLENYSYIHIEEGKYNKESSLRELMRIVENLDLYFYEHKELNTISVLTEKELGEGPIYTIIWRFKAKAPEKIESILSNLRNQRISHLAKIDFNEKQRSVTINAPQIPFQKLKDILQKQDPLHKVTEAK